jgi:hypothetical protein
LLKTSGSDSPSVESNCPCLWLETAMKSRTMGPFCSHQNSWNLCNVHFP